MGFGRRAPRLAGALAIRLGLSLWGPLAGAQTLNDYDPQNRGWNGTAELVAGATGVDVELVPTQTLDWDHLQRGHGLLVVYPREAVSVPDLSAFLEEGGRVAWFDDFGRSDEVWRWFQFRREPGVVGTARSPELPELLLARPRLVHPLTEGVDTLVTNIPVGLTHPRLSPLFEFVGDDPRGLLLVGQIGQGKLVACGDPSVLLNTMQRFPGNRRFSENLMQFLAGGRGGRVTLVWGDFTQRGSYHGRTRPRTRAREAVVTLNDAFGSLSSLVAMPRVARPLGLIVALAAMAVFAVLSWGRRPSERYGPRGPVGSAAGATERAAIFTAPGANLFVPAIIARRLLEHRLLKATGLKAPIDLRAVLDRLSTQIGAAERDTIRSLLVTLEGLHEAAERDERVTVSPRRFLSIWRQIGAILPRLERDRANDG